jgi:hypothetical protein
LGRRLRGRLGNRGRCKQQRENREESRHES